MLHDVVDNSVDAVIVMVDRLQPFARLRFSSMIKCQHLWWLLGLCDRCQWKPCATYRQQQQSHNKLHCDE